MRSVPTVLGDMKPVLARRLGLVHRLVGQFQQRFLAVRAVRVGEGDSHAGGTGQLGSVYGAHRLGSLDDFLSDGPGVGERIFQVVEDDREFVPRQPADVI